MNKSGFIATSLLYSFFLLFCALILMFAINIGHNSILLNKEKDKINEDIHSNKRIMHAEVGSYFRLNVCIDKNKRELFNSADTMDYILFKNDDENGFGHLVAKNLSYKLNSLELLNEILNSVYVKNGQEKIISRSMSENDYNTIVKLDENIQKIILNSDFDDDSKGDPKGKNTVKYLLANNRNNYYSNSKVYNVYLQKPEDEEISSDSSDITEGKIFIRLVFDINSLTEIIGGDGTLSNPYVLEGGASACDNIE